MGRLMEQSASPADPDAVHEMITGRIPLGRYADPAEIAGLAAFLASDDAEYITGIAVPIDGGLLASFP
jgi:NAD(P)-dependent dehydrogenase (short-subunit alcohol dehydrogenase family)